MSYLHSSALSTSYYVDLIFNLFVFILTAKIELVDGEPAVQSNICDHWFITFVLSFILKLFKICLLQFTYMCTYSIHPLFVIFIFKYDMFVLMPF